MQKEPAQKGKDSPTRVILIILLVLWLITFAALLGVSWKAYFSEKEGAAQTLAQQIAFACKNGTFGPGISDEDVKAMCRTQRPSRKTKGKCKTGKYKSLRIKIQSSRTPSYCRSQKFRTQRIRIKRASKMRFKILRIRSLKIRIQRSRKMSRKIRRSRTTKIRIRKSRVERPKS